MTNFDANVIGTMDVPECMQLQEALVARIRELQTVKADELREKWRQEAAALGMDAEFLLEGGHVKKKRGRGRRNGHVSA